MSSGARQRRDDIVLLAHTSGLTSIEELSARFDVTASTIRRDLARLTGEGKIARTYGGAMALTGNGGESTIRQRNQEAAAAKRAIARLARTLVHDGESTFRQRNQEAAAAKRAIARLARTLVHDGESILLDAGSSVAALDTELQHDISLTVATTSLAVLEELADVDAIHVECLGGTLRHPSQGFVGTLAEAALERMTFDRVFLGAGGVAEDSICEADLQQTRLKEMMCRQAHEVVVLADASKLGAAPFHAWAKLPEGWTLVTDDSATEEQLEPFYLAGVEVVVATVTPLVPETPEM